MEHAVKKIVKENTLALLASAALSVFAGVFLQINLKRLVAVPALLVLIPPINALAGHIGGALGARLGSALHLGLIEPALRRQRVLGQNMLGSASSGLASFFLISVAMGVWFWLRGLANPFLLGLTFFLAGVILIPLVVLASTFIALFSYMRGLDPDNIVGPLLTSIADILGVLSLLLVQHLLLA
jgi:mgtE-like transporter